MLTDLKFSLRSLRRYPAFAFAAIATLAVGIGATTAIFSTVNAAILRPLPFPHPEDLYALDTPATDGRFTTGLVSGVELLHLISPSVSIAHASGASRADTTLLRDDGTAVSARGFGVTDGFFELFGVPVYAGRSFTHAEFAPGAASVVVLSYQVWQDLFGSDPMIVGRSIRLASGPPAPAQVVGIAARDFDIPHGADFWTNFAITPQATGHGFQGYVRIKPGTRLERLQSEMAGAMAGIAKDYGMLGKNRRYALMPLADSIVGDLRSTC